MSTTTTTKTPERILVRDLVGFHYLGHAVRLSDGTTGSLYAVHLEVHRRYEAKLELYVFKRMRRETFTVSKVSMVELL